MNASHAVRREMARMLGPNIIYLSTSSEDRRLDPMSLASAYATELLIIFLVAFGKRLQRHVEDYAKKKGEEAADALWQWAKTVVGQYKDESKEENPGENIRAAIHAGRGAVEEELRTKRFPPLPAQEIANGLTEAIQKHLES